MSRVVVGYDGSPASRRALAHAARLAGRRGRLTVVHVIPAGSVSSRLASVTEGAVQQQSRLLDEAELLLQTDQLEVETVGAAGDPAAELLAAAEEAHADYIVVGRRGKPSRPRLRRSVSLKLARSADCDVVVVHE